MTPRNTTQAPHATHPSEPVESPHASQHTESSQYARSAQHVPSSRSAWLTLLLAGAFEVGYALSVGGSRGFTVLSWSAVAVVFFLLTLWALSRALRTIEVGIGYAVWAGIGAVGAALLGPVFFNETFPPAKAAWLAVTITGVISLKLADRQRR